MKTRTRISFKTMHSKATVPASLIFALTTLALPPPGHSQGTTVITFNGQPPGTQANPSLYTEAGMNFWNPYGPQDPLPTGPGIPGMPQNGTAYLDMPTGSQLTFSLVSGGYFGLVSFDAAREYASLPATNIEVIGFLPMAATVTNYFNLDSLANRRANNLPDFQTFYLDAQFQHVYRVDILNDRWCFDNAVVTGIPEPSTGSLLLVGTLAIAAHQKTRKRRPGNGNASKCANQQSSS